jgi:hypothetical protein
MRGDCEAKSLIFASLLAGRKIPFTLRASFHHLWVDYQGRPPRPGETSDLAYLQGKEGRLALTLPHAVDLRDFLSVQRQLLWEEMPPFRRSTWLVGLLWLALVVLVRIVRLPRGECASHWRPSRSSFAVQSLLAFSLLLLALVLLPPGTRGAPARWTLLDLREAGACCALTGAFLVWLFSWHLRRRPLTVSIAEDGLLALSLRSVFPRRRALSLEDLRHLQLDPTSDPSRPWRVSAVGRDGRRLALLDYFSELEARQALRGLGLQTGRPLVIRLEGVETVIPPEEIGRPLRARGLLTHDLPPRPKTLDLVVETEEGRWTLRYPHLPRGVRWLLLLGALLPAGVFALLCWLVGEFTESRSLWLTWVLGGAFLSMTVFLVIALKEEMLARLGEARVEIADGLLRYHDPNRRVTELPIDTLETIELGRRDGSPTLLLTSPDQLLHLPGLCTEEEREWVKGVIEKAVLEAGAEVAV